MFTLCLCACACVRLCLCVWLTLCNGGTQTWTPRAVSPDIVVFDSRRRLHLPGPEWFLFARYIVHSSGAIEVVRKVIQVNIFAWRDFYCWLALHNVPCVISLVQCPFWHGQSLILLHVSIRPGFCVPMMVRFYEYEWGTSQDGTFYIHPQDYQRYTNEWWALLNGTF